MCCLSQILIAPIELLASGEKHHRKVTGIFKINKKNQNGCNRNHLPKYIWVNLFVNFRVKIDAKRKYIFVANYFNYLLCVKKAICI